MTKLYENMKRQYLQQLIRKKRFQIHILVAAPEIRAFEFPRKEEKKKNNKRNWTASFPSHTKEKLNVI